MTKYVEQSRKALPVNVRFKNILTDKNRLRTTDQFRRLDNLLWNSFGPPKFELRYDGGRNRRHYFLHNKDSVWYRSRNEVLLRDEKILELVMKFKPDEIVLTKDII